MGVSKVAAISVVVSVDIKFRLFLRRGERDGLFKVVR